jgi:hypothetical protein
MNKLKEAIKTPIGTAIMLTIVVITLLIVFTIIKDMILAGKTIDAFIIFLALLPFVIYLAVTGKISEIGGGGFGIKFNKVSEAKVSFKSEGTVAYVDEAVVEKGGIDELIDKILPEIAENPRSTLNLKSRGYEYYTYPALKRYLEELTRFDFFKYVLFVDENDLFNGYVYARSLLAQLFDESRGKEIVENINKWHLDKIIGVKKNSIKNYQSNRETLRIMEGEGITDIAVVDKDMKFKGFTNREMITSRIVNNLMITAE